MNLQPSDLKRLHEGFDVFRMDGIEPLQVGPGCYRRDLPDMGGMRVWVVDLDPGCEWPCVDQHPRGEAYVVLRGEICEGGEVHGEGTCVMFKPGSSHRPRTLQGVRLFGFNPMPDSGASWAAHLIRKEEPW